MWRTRRRQRQSDQRGLNDRCCARLPSDFSQWRGGVVGVACRRRVLGAADAFQESLSEGSLTEARRHGGQGNANITRARSDRMGKAERREEKRREEKRREEKRRENYSLLDSLPQRRAATVWKTWPPRLCGNSSAKLSAGSPARSHLDGCADAGDDFVEGALLLRASGVYVTAAAETRCEFVHIDERAIGAGRL